MNRLGLNFDDELTWFEKLLCFFGCHCWETTYEDGWYECGRCGKLSVGPKKFEDESGYPK